MTEKLAEVYAGLKKAAYLAIQNGIDAYDFRRASATAIRQAAIEASSGNKSAAARRIKLHRNNIDKGIINQ